MGVYVNPGNNGFKELIKSGNYIDKTSMISYVNSVLNTRNKEICFTRPRRFGKTCAADMLCAYYSCGCDSKDLFQNLKIADDPSFEKHLNQYPVIYFGLIDFMTYKEVRRDQIIQFIQREINEELKKEYPETNVETDISLARNLIRISSATGEKFIIIIDEWDMILREEKDNTALQDEYINFLRSLFRGTQVSDFLACAYMTGILPIIKYNTQSALSDFREYTMINPRNLGEYIGFTEEDVKKVCSMYPEADFEEMQRWYDGYYVKRIGHIYCPNSVMQAAPFGEYKSYWAQTSAFESLKMYIEMNFDGLKDSILDMLDDREVTVDVASFENNLNQINSRDDVLTVLVHLGYLAYDEMKRIVRIPNLEIRQNFLRAIKTGTSRDFIDRIKRSDAVIEATIHRDETRLAELIQEVHDNRPPRYYNNEQALRYVILNAYDYTPMCWYTVFEELSSGQGFSDMMLIPQKGTGKPALIIELKYDQSPEKAIEQIRDKHYMSHLEKQHYSGEVYLIGIGYDSKKKEHTCRIVSETI